VIISIFFTVDGTNEIETTTGDDHYVGTDTEFGIMTTTDVTTGMTVT